MNKDTNTIKEYTLSSEEFLIPSMFRSFAFCYLLSLLCNVSHVSGCHLFTGQFYFVMWRRFPRQGKKIERNGSHAVTHFIGVPNFQEGKQIIKRRGKTKREDGKEQSI